MWSTIRSIISSQNMRKLRPAVKSLINDLEAQLSSIKSAGTYKHERVISTPQGVTIFAEGKDVLNFCANNYLGLANHPDVIRGAQEIMNRRGYGMSSVRFICGTQDSHKILEQKLAEFHGTEDAMLYTSCFDANGSIFEAILDQTDAVFSDELNHASIIDGIRLCKAKRLRYRHLDVNNLEEQLKEAKDARHKLIATDGAFSMDGDLAPLPKIMELANKYGCMVFVDDSHGTGVFGKTGRGVAEHFNLEKEVDVINSTLGKALGGGIGGYTVGERAVIELIRQKGRPYLFSNAVAPSVIGATLKVFDLLKDLSHLELLRKNTAHFREEMIKRGFKLLGNPLSPIVPIWLGDAKLAGEIANEMMEQGIYVIGFSYPVVPKGQARIRVQLSAIHKPEHIDKAIRAFTEIGKKKGLIQSTSLIGFCQSV
eukprot:TRINITY_DN984_c0_g1_i3.p1 TRINITY_DN984_c0_g1~~TRINITY_DN984_c0_g1_i3.p1  ORF type:complete len:426 (-),score=23.87 TRINITY_DN984_c0_g1_i3:42-1319(-)